MISIILPVLNEEVALPETLARLQRKASDHEIIVVDGGSQDRTREVVEAFEGVSWRSASPGRARQMNRGARDAVGDWLLFLHADTFLPELALKAIENLDTTCQAGCFRQRFSRQHWVLQGVSWLHNWRCQRSRIMYGDQAMFIRRSLFERIGGFPDQAILEDVAISETIKQHTTPQMLPLTVTTSSRKFDQRGPLRAFFDVAIILSCYELRLPILRRGFFASYR